MVTISSGARGRGDAAGGLFRSEVAAVDSHVIGVQRSRVVHREEFAKAPRGDQLASAGCLVEIDVTPWVGLNETAAAPSWGGENLRNGECSASSGRFDVYGSGQRLPVRRCGMGAATFDVPWGR